MTQLMHVRVGDELAKGIAGVVKEGYFVSPSDFVREALRNYLQQVRQKEALRLLDKNFGFAKKAGIPEPTEEDYERAREKVWNELHELRRRNP